MRNLKLQTSNLRNKFKFVRANWQTIFLFALLLAAVLTFSRVSAQTEVTSPAPTFFLVGERLTYNLSFETFKNGGVAEIYVVSRGKLADKDAVELQGRIKTTNLVGAAFYFLDESRTTYAAPDTGLPLYIRKTTNSAAVPQETINNFLAVPTANFDLLTLIYQARHSGGIGTFPLQEDEKIYSAAFQNAGNEKVKTDLGEFVTSVSTVQSEFLTEKSITNLRINFTTDDERIPVLIRFRTAKGEFRAEITGIQKPTLETTPIPLLTPRPSVTPKVSPTPLPYVPNQPLSKDLSFNLGETLEYQITASGKFIGNVTLQAKERKQIDNLYRQSRETKLDSLLLTATVTKSQPDQQILSLNDRIETLVNPDSVTPYQFNVKLSGLFKEYNQSVLFRQEDGKAIVNGTVSVDIPVGTHNLLSLIYAVRSFNLRPIKDRNNVIIGTRVAVFFGASATVFTLNPAEAEAIEFNGKKISAQPITIITGNQRVDSQLIRLWLSNDEKRLPLRLTVGNIYQADLISEKIIPPG